MTRTSSHMRPIRGLFLLGIATSMGCGLACSTITEGSREENASGGGSFDGMGDGGGDDTGSGGQSFGSGGAPNGGGSGGGGAVENSGGSDPGTGGATSAEPSSGCGKVSTVTFEAVPGETEDAHGFGEGGYVRMESGGDSRGFAVRLPDDYDSSKPYPLIFGFHWNGGNSKEVDTGGSNGYNMAHFGLQKLSNNGAIFVAPDGLNAGWANTNGRDIAFVDQIVKLIEENYCVDKSRLFANGFSYGGMMSHAIACARADVFRGVAVYNGAELSGCDGGEEPIAYWIMAGITDNVCTLDMAKPMRDRFVSNNGCTPQDPPQPPPPEPYLNPGGHVCTDYEGCMSGYPVRFCVHQSGHGNAVVDGTGDLWNSCATAPNTCSDECPCTWVPDDVWSFFNSL